MSSVQFYVTYGFQIGLGTFMVLANSISIPVLKSANLGLSKVTVFLLINLALADILFGGGLVIRGLIFVFGAASFQGCLILLCILSTSVVSTFGTLLISSAYNLYNCQGKLMNIEKNYKVVIILQAVYWIISVTVGSTMSIAPNRGVPITTCSLTDDMVNEISLLLITTWWLIPLLASIVLQICTAIKLKKILKTKGEKKNRVGMLEPPTTTVTVISVAAAESTVHNGNTTEGTSRGGQSSIKTQPTQSNRSKQFRKSIVLFALVFALLLVCWLPFVVVAFLKGILPPTMEVTKVVPFFGALGLVNSGVNFFIYLIKMKSFRMTLWKTLTCKR